MLDLYKNIRKRRKELKMTQTELALKVGYTNRSTIATIESGAVDLPQSKILEFAKALDTTPSSLMGWDDDDFDEVIDAPEGTGELILLFSKANEEQRKAVLNLLRSFCQQEH